MNLVHNNDYSNNSPFDSIRHVDEKNNEYWIARELMAVLGYVKWERFNSVILNAFENIETATNNPKEHFFPVEIKTKGRPRLDYKLTRLACYHVALCCDSRGNDAVKKAKHYFAVKTREAEVIIPQQNAKLEEMKLQLELLKAEKDVYVAQQKLIETRDTIVKMCPEIVQQKILGFQIIEKVEEKEVVVDSSTNRRYDGIGITYIRKSLSFDSNKECWTWLEKHGYGKKSGVWRKELSAIESDKISREVFEEIKQAWKDDPYRKQYIVEHTHPKSLFD